MARGIIRAAIYLASAVLIFLGFVFVVSVNLGLDYFLVGLVFLAVAGFLLLRPREKTYRD